GYTEPDLGFSADTCAILVSLKRQSPDIARGVTAGTGLYKEQGAGDQGMMYGYACDETPEMMPMPIMFAHRLTRRLAEVRKKGVLPFLKPDGKSQVSVLYEDGVPVAIENVVVSTQHADGIPYRQIREAVIEEVVRPVIPAELLTRRTRYFVNPTGRFVVGGPHGDCGLTGRKIIVDTYGGVGRHGGGAFSGKDPSKVDRSAAYMARYVAKTIVAAGLAKRCEFRLAYAIGYPKPLAVNVETFGTGKVPDDQIEKAVAAVFRFKPAEIIRDLDLLRPIYEATSAYGHFGHNSDFTTFTWERTDKAARLADVLGVRWEKRAL
ncbi:MAG: methionine adenosyltransferase, partial [Kiritimatiellae bacterium]|nr:methionine adenosyltransferase [Kiritimatiellia bacterium]